MNRISATHQVINAGHLNNNRSWYLKPRSPGPEPWIPPYLQGGHGADRCRGRDGKWRHRQQTWHLSNSGVRKGVQQALLRGRRVVQVCTAVPAHAKGPSGGAQVRGGDLRAGCHPPSVLSWGAGLRCLARPGATVHASVSAAQLNLIGPPSSRPSQDEEASPTRENAGALVTHTFKRMAQEPTVLPVSDPWAERQGPEPPTATREGASSSHSLAEHFWCLSLVCRPCDLGPLIPSHATLENPSRDYTPPAYIGLLVTDLGVLTAAGVSDELIQLYL